jgi:hypothetical protein
MRPPQRFSLVVVVCAILVVVRSTSAAEPEQGTALETEVKGEVATYADSDSVSVVSPSVAATVSAPLDGWSAGGSYMVDIVSAASVDIVSTASGRWNEVRHAGTLHAQYKPGAWGASVSGAVSREPDYLSLSGGGAITADLAHKTVTPKLGYTYSHDIAGRSGTPFSVYSLALDRHTLTAETLLLADRETVVTLDADAIFEVGRQEKPYRYLPVFAPGVAAGIPVGASIDTVNALRLPGRVAERLPTTRQRYAFAARLAQRLADSTFVLTERVYADSWGMHASTTDLKMVFDVSRRLWVWPDFRAHFQNGVSFWQLAYTGSVDANGTLRVPKLRTGDRELGPISAGSFGAGAHWNFGSGSDPTKLALILLTDATITHYHEALFTDQRLSMFSALQLEASF